MRRLIEEIGLEGRRVQMINLSSAMGGQFAFAAAEMTAEIKQLGPSPLRRKTVDPRIREEAEAAFKDAPDLAPRDPA